MVAASELAINTGANATLTITYLNGRSVVVGTSKTLNTGQTVTLNAGGTITVVSDGDIEEYNFIYSVTNGSSSASAVRNTGRLSRSMAGNLGSRWL